MTYKDQFVAEVKVNGKILRVRNDEVFLPFGSEYSLLLKNLNSVRASVKVSIDGTDALDGNSLVITPNQTSELQGFLRGNTAKNRFRFINKSKEIQEHRGDKIEDGLVRIEFAFENPIPLLNFYSNNYYYHTPYNPFDQVYRGVTYSSSSSGSGSASSSNIGQAMGEVVNHCFHVDANLNASDPLPDEGITVKGSEINQNFQYTAMGNLGQASVIVIKLKGDTITGNYVAAPLTVERRLICKTCGRTSSSSNKFCPNCGTYLE